MTADNVENQIFKPYKFHTHARTITETDIVNFVNLISLHEPFFIDMEFINKNMQGRNKERFAPGVMLISLGQGLVSTQMMSIVDHVAEDHTLGKFAGMTGIDSKIKGSVFVGDTVHVEGEAKITRITSKGMAVMDIVHHLLNQKGEDVCEFTETVLFHAP
jgi:acyl dehydratase